MNHEANQKVTARHLSRKAYLYVRQSTMRQVVENTESTDRQYALRERAVALGWPEESIVVIDTDLGQSGASAVDREGFQKLVAEVGMGNAGIVLGLEVSRLARNSSDWHRLLEICALSSTLILDEDGVYDPAHFNDRLLLGMKGTMSEAELHILRARLRGGLINKARRGELRLGLPVGFVRDERDQVVLDPDQQVQDRVKLLFETFRRTGAVAATVKHFRRQGWEFPARLRGGPGAGKLVWARLTVGRTASVLHSPWYAGAYAYGRMRWTPRGHGRRSPERRPIGEWTVLIQDTHPGYITWEQYMEHQQRMERNTGPMQRHSGKTPAREGPALLQGRALCGICGCRMHVHYDRRADIQAVRYVCFGPETQQGAPSCQTIVGTGIDAAMSRLVLDAVTPAALEVTLAVQDELRRRAEETDRMRRQTVERAQYEADVARERYMHVDPGNRLVAASLEAEWNAKLRERDLVVEEYDRLRRDDERALGARERERILDLASNFPKVWRNPQTPHRERKRLLGLIIEDVTLVRSDRITAQVRFRGGATTTISVARPMTIVQKCTTAAETWRLIDELLEEHTDAAVARILNERGIRSGTGGEFKPTKIEWLRYSYKLRSHKQRLLDAGMLTTNQMLTQLGVGRTTLGSWRAKGLVQARIATDRGEWLYWPPDEVPQRRRSPRIPRTSNRNATDNSPARGAV